MQGDAAAWSKAMAMTLLDIAAENGRKFALIHFSSPGRCQTDLFRPGEYTAEEKLAAETFLDGGTDYETPLREAVGLLKSGGFENADIVFLTDGYCELSPAFAEELAATQQELAFKITGILLDTDIGNGDFSLQPFCEKIYRTSEMFQNDIVQKLVSQRV